MNNSKLTELEIKMLKDINKSYIEHHIENTEFYNLYSGYCEEDELLRKQLRGTFTSLKRKKIVRHYNDPHCFNPIYPTTKFVEVMKSLGETISDEVYKYL